MRILLIWHFFNDPKKNFRPQYSHSPSALTLGAFTSVSRNQAGRLRPLLILTDSSFAEGMCKE